MEIYVARTFVADICLSAELYLSQGRILTFPATHASSSDNSSVEQFWIYSDITYTESLRGPDFRSGRVGQLDVDSPTSSVVFLYHCLFVR